MRHELAAREYELLLDPSKFVEPPSEKVANTLPSKFVTPTITNRLDSREDGQSRALQGFDTPKERTIRFWDTPDYILTASDFALRSRVDAKDGEALSLEKEVTLKLRMEDYFIVASTLLPGANSRANTKFEENIAPLEVKPPAAGTSVVFPGEHSIRNRFSLSTTQVREWGKPERTTEALRLLFPTLEENLKHPYAFAREEALVGGPIVHEFVNKGARVKLSENVIGDFTLTLWYFETVDIPPAVAEISFKCATINGETPGKAARRVLDLFIGLQIDLGDYSPSEMWPAIKSANAI
jgi:hypothetical protein